MARKDKALIGAAGEHLVLSRLLTFGLLASAAPRGARTVDILVNSLDDRKPLLVQVKTTVVGVSNGWPMGAKHEEVRDEDLFYTFVDLKPSHPDVYVIPAATVAEVLVKDHQRWLNTPGKEGQPHNDSKMRRLRPSCHGQQEDWLTAYREKWEPFLAHAH